MNSYLGANVGAQEIAAKNAAMQYAQSNSVASDSLVLAISALAENVSLIESQIGCSQPCTEPLKQPSNAMVDEMFAIKSIVRDLNLRLSNCNKAISELKSVIGT